MQSLIVWPRVCRRRQIIDVNCHRLAYIGLHTYRPRLGLYDAKSIATQQLPNQTTSYTVVTQVYASILYSLYQYRLAMSTCDRQTDR